MRPRTPTVIKKAQGTLRPDRQPAKEANPVKRLPSAPPKLMDTVARREWNRAGKFLEQQGLMTDMDLMMLAGYCLAVSDLYRCEKVLMEKGLTTEVTLTRGGGVREVVRPEVDVKYKALATVKKFAVEFGMSPASRSRVTADPPVDEVEAKIKKYMM